MQVKAEFGRILSNPKAVRNVADNYHNIEEKVLEWAGRSTNRNVQLLVSEMQTMLLEEPNTKAGRETYATFSPFFFCYADLTLRFEVTLFRRVVLH